MDAYLRDAARRRAAGRFDLPIAIAFSLLLHGAILFIPLQASISPPAARSPENRMLLLSLGNPPRPTRASPNSAEASLPAGARPAEPEAPSPELTESAENSPDPPAKLPEAEPAGPDLPEAAQPLAEPTSSAELPEAGLAIGPPPPAPKAASAAERAALTPGLRPIAAAAAILAPRKAPQVPAPPTAPSAASSGAVEAPAAETTPIPDRKSVV